MNAGVRFLFALVLFSATPVFAAKPTSTPVPSVQLRRIIDKTLPGISTISDPKEKPFDRTALTMAQANYTAQALTAPPAQQPMYQAAQNLITMLVGAVEEHEKAVADFRYSENLHGKQDREDAKISNPQRGWNAGAVARADNAKQKMENADSRKALLDKEQFLSNGAIAAWTSRVQQLHDAIEQSYVAELVTEKQLAMLTPPAPPTAPTPKPTHKTKEPSASQQYSPVGSWKTVIPGHRAPTLNEDNTVVSGKRTGTWNWTDQSKGALCIVWNDGLRADLNFSSDGRAMTGTVSKGGQESYIRSTEAASAASTAPPPTAPKPAGPQPSATAMNSPVGSWKTVIAGHPWTHRSPTLNEDNTATAGNGKTGTWNWTDQSQGALCIVWKDGLRADLNFSPDGRAMTGTVSNGAKESYIRSTEAAPDASRSPSDASTEAPAIAEIRLKADPTKGLLVQRDKPAALSPGEASKIRILPGLKDSRFVSLQLDGAKGFYLRHQRGVLYLHEQPQLNTLFEEDASFKLVHLDGDKVRFESCNFPGTFITARDDGSVVVIRDPLPAQSIFVLKSE